MAIAKDCHIRVYLVANHYDAMLVAEVSQSSQCIRIPTDACRIMRIAQNKQSGLVIYDFGQLVKVHLVGAIGFLKWIVHHFATIALGCETERMIYRSLNDDLFILFHKYIDSHAYTFYYSWDIGEPLKLYIPLMVVGYPLNYSSPQFIGHYGISKQRVLKSLA